jgi:hypothetical protein
VAIVEPHLQPQLLAGMQHHQFLAGTPAQH